VDKQNLTICPVRTLDTFTVAIAFFSGEAFFCFLDIAYNISSRLSLYLQDTGIILSDCVYKIELASY